MERLNIFPKTFDDFKERTGSGAAVSVISCTVVCSAAALYDSSFFTFELSLGSYCYLWLLVTIVVSVNVSLFISAYLRFRNDCELP